MNPAMDPSNRRGANGTRSFWTWESMRDTLSLLLLPGTGIRRWLLLGAVGGLVFAVGLAYVIRYYGRVTLPHFLPGPVEGPFFMLIALALIAVAGARLTSLIWSARSAGLPNESLRASMMRLREQARAPIVVAIGGGTGLSSLLRGLKSRAQVTGIVTVADDGGSSGRLRQELGVLPPGDIRNCIVALADAEPLMKDLFQYRFGPGSTLEGHSFGNLFIAALTATTGSFEEAVNESNRILNVRGRIVPATLENVSLAAELDSGETRLGESNIPVPGHTVRRLQLEPSSPTAYAGAIEALRAAQLIAIGPGSLFTSIIPNLLIPGIRDEINRSAAPVVYICNVASQPGETEGFDVADHVRAILEHCPGLRIDFAVVNNNLTPLEAENPAHLIRLRDFEFPGITIRETDLMASGFRTHHDPDKLANAVLGTYHDAVRASNSSGSRGRRAELAATRQR